MNDATETGSAEFAAPFRRIVLRGLGAAGVASQTAIRLVDDAGDMLQSAPIAEDGSCDVREDALACAYEVRFEPSLDVRLRADAFRELVAAEGTVDIAALLATASREAPGRVLGVTELRHHPDDGPGH